MARPTDANLPRDHYVRTRVSAPEKELLTKMRGSVSESDYVRMLMRDEAVRRGLA